jgi:mRNA interferase MazF
LKRGDIVTVSAAGDYGKPRPALVVQSDLFNDTHPSVTLCLVTTELRDTPLFRLTVEPHESNGLRRLSQVQVDKLLTVAAQRVGRKIGQLDDDTMIRVNRALAVWLGIA